MENKNIPLNHHWVKEGTTREMRKRWETEENENTAHPRLPDAAKAVLRGERKVGIAYVSFLPYTHVPLLL